MGRLLGLIALASAIAAAAVMTAFDPEQGFAVLIAVLALSVFAGATVGLLQMLLRSPRRGRARERGDARSLRRAGEAAVMIALLLALRVIDGLTLVTGGFIVASFIAAELIVSTRPGPSSR